MENDEGAAPSRMERWVLGAVLLGTALACWKGTSEPFMTLKVAVALVCALASVGVGVFVLLRRGEVLVPRGWAVGSVMGFLLFGVIAVANSESTGISLWGQQERGTGFLLYLACSVLFLAAVAVAGGGNRSWTPLLYAVLGAVAVVAVYALIQRSGNDPFTWGTRLSPDAPFSTMGNVNFASGYLAIGLAPALWLATVRSRPHRVVGIVLAALVVAGLAVTESAQGLVAAAAGAMVVLVAMLLEREPAAQRRWLRMTAGLGALGLVLVLLGVIGHGPLASFNDTGLAFRRDYWSASVRMFRDHPIDGVGFDMWAGYYRAFRSTDAAAGIGFRAVADEPHSVVLGMFTSGGILLGAAYLAFVATTGWALVRGLLRFEGPSRLLLGGLGGAWLAYQVQSFVSIDMPALPVAHFVLAGLIVGSTGASRWRSIAAGRRKAPTFSPAVLAGAIAVSVVLVGSWFGVRQLRADYHMRLASDRLAAGDVRGIGELAEAADLTPLPAPWIRTGEQFAQLGRFEFALIAARHGIERDPRSLLATLDAARMATNLNNPELIQQYYERARELEPHSGELVAEMATSYAKVDLLPQALELADEAVGMEPDSSLAWSSRGDVLLKVKRKTGARQSYEKALALDPYNTDATNALAVLDS